MRFNKKAQFDMSRKVVYYLIALFVLAFIVIYMSSIIRSGNLRDVSLLSKASGNILAAELLTSQNCFSTFDEDLSRVYPGIIEENNLLEESLQNCGKYFPDKFSISIKDKKFGDEDFSGKKFSRPVIVNGNLEEAKLEVQNA